MSQDPQPEHNPDPPKHYTDPSAYEVPSPPPAEVPSYPPQDPPPTYYGEYQQPPYSTTPPGPYGTPGYDPNQAGYGYQASSPLPLKEAINQLPNQYIKVLTQPSPSTFAAEMGKANWNILWVQLIAYAVISSILNYLYSFMPGAFDTYSTSSDAYTTQFFNLLQEITRVMALGSIIFIPISFFIGQGIIYLLAKAFGGTGTFLRQGYTYLLITVPINIIANVVTFIPILGGLLAFGLGIYSIVLQIFSLMPVHRLSGRKATAVILIPIGISLLLGIIFGLIFAIAIISTLPPGSSPSSP